MEGATLGPYRLERRIGAGGMGEVFVATVVEQSPAGREGARVAVKVIHSQLLERRGFFKRFLREAQLGRTLDHPNVVRTFDADAIVHEGRQCNFLVMEFVEGQTLRSLLDELTKVPEELCRHIAREIACGLHAIHSAGVIHRDLKPENVLITGEHHVKIMDLGLARLQDEMMRISRSGEFVGSLLYASPEDFRSDGSRVDARTDLHAAGVLLYELSTGVNPFAAEDFRVVVKNLLEKVPAPPTKLNASLSRYFETVVLTLLAKDPSERFQSAADLESALRDAEDSAWWRAHRNRRSQSSHGAHRLDVERETVVIGRDEELGRLREAFDRAASGRGQVVLIEGEDGIGKSRLVDEFVTRLDGDGVEFDFVCGAFLRGSATTASAAFVTGFRRYLGDEEVRAWLERHLSAVPRLVPLLSARLLGEPVPASGTPATDEAIESAFVHLARSISRDRPLVVVADDAHLAGDEGRGTFVALAQAITLDRVLLIGTTSGASAAPWLASIERLGHTTRLPLRRLSPKQIMGVLADALGSVDLAERIGWKIAQKSDGNPMFIFEILRMLRENGVLHKDEGVGWVCRRAIEQIDVPSAVVDLVRARIGELDDDERELLDVASCIGYEFDPALAAEALEQAAIPILKLFNRIERKHGLVRSVGRNYCFDQHQVQSILYEAVFAQLRERYHAAIGTALERRAGLERPGASPRPLPLDLCTHFVRAGEHERARLYLAPALSALEERHQIDAALALSGEALGVPLLLEGVDRLDLLEKRADWLGLRGLREDERAAIEEALRLCEGNPDLEGRAISVLRRLGVHLWRTSSYAEARSVLERATERAAARGDPAAEAPIIGNLGLVHYHLGEFDAAGSSIGRQLALARSTGDLRGQATATGNLAVVQLALGEYAESKANFETCLSISRELRFNDGELSALGNLGIVSMAQGRLDAARSQFLEHRTRARQIGDRRGEAIATGNLAGVSCALGQLDVSTIEAQRFLELAREVGTPRFEGLAHYRRAMIERNAKGLRSARSSLESGLRIQREIGHRTDATKSLFALGVVAHELGEFDVAASFISQALADATSLRFPDVVVPATSLLAALGQASVAHAIECLSTHDGRLSHGVRMESRFYLFEATRRRIYIDEAATLLDELRAHAPEDARMQMVGNVELHRRIVVAARGESLGSDPG